MIRSERALGLIGLLVGLLVALVWVAPAGANPDTPDKDYLLTQPGSGRPTGGRLQIGTGLPLPVGADGIFTGGQMAATGTIITRNLTMTMVTTTGAGIWPHDINPLASQGLVLPHPAAVTPGAPTPAKRIRQNLATAQGGAVKIPPLVLTDMIGTSNPRHGGVFNTNPAVYDVATTLSYEWPAASGVGGGTVTFASGVGPAPAFPGSITIMGPGGGTITYSQASAAGKSFGGVGVFAIRPGPSAGTRLVPMNLAGMKPIATVFINAAQGAPTMVGFAGLVGASTAGLSMAPQGASLAAPSYTTMFGKIMSPLHTVNMGLPACTDHCVGMNGTIAGVPNDPITITTWSVGPAFGTLTHNNATTEGFPWTTGLITVSAPGALGGETFFLVGTDMRGSGAGTTGVGNLSLVAGSLSTRNISKANANRGFLSLNLPEPAAALGAAGALGMLALCHALVRRRSR